MSLPSRILRVFVCFCFLFLASQTAFSQDGDQDLREGYKKHVNGIFKAYDSDNNGSLSAGEVAKMRRKPDQEADANSDGEISKAELLDRYLIKRGLLKTGRRNNSDSRFRQKETAPKPKPKVKKLDNTVTLVCNDAKITLLGDADDVASVEAMLQKVVKEASGAKAVPAREGSVGLSVWIVNASSSIDMSELDGKPKKLVATMMSKLAEDSTVQIEELHVDTILGRRVELYRSGKVPVVSGVNQSRGVKSNQISTYEVGTKLTAEATRSGKNVLIDFHVEKSTVEDSGVALAESDDETIFAKAVQQYELSAEVQCQPGKACVVNSKKNESAWTLIFCADAAATPTSNDNGDVRRDDSRKRQRRSRD